MEHYCKSILNEPLYWGMTLNERLKYYKISAFSLSLINDGKIDLTYCYGYKNKDAEDTVKENVVTENTLFQAEENKGYVAMMNSYIGAGFYHELDWTISKLMDI